MKTETALFLMENAIVRTMIYQQVLYTVTQSNDQTFPPKSILTKKTKVK